VAAAIGVGGEIRDSMRGGGGAALRMRTKRMEPRLPQLAPRRGQTMAGGLMGEINRSVEKMSLGDNSGGGGGGSMMMSQVGGEGSSGMAGGKLRGGTAMPPHSTLLQNTGSSRQGPLIFFSHLFDVNSLRGSFLLGLLS